MPRTIRSLPRAGLVAVLLWGGTTPALSQAYLQQVTPARPAGAAVYVDQVPQSARQQAPQQVAPVRQQTGASSARRAVSVPAQPRRAVEFVQPHVGAPLPAEADLAIETRAIASGALPRAAPARMAILASERDTHLPNVGAGAVGR